MNTKKKTATAWLAAALSLLRVLPLAQAETREGVIWLEGMEEPIEETLYESPLGFSFWYANERLDARPGEADGVEGVTVGALYSDDFMFLSVVTQEEAAEYPGTDAAELFAGPRAQAELYRETEGSVVSFGVLVAETGIASSQPAGTPWKPPRATPGISSGCSTASPSRRTARSARSGARRMMRSPAARR